MTHFMYGNFTFRAFKSDLEAAQAIEREGHSCLLYVEMITNESEQSQHLGYKETLQDFSARACAWFYESARQQADNYSI